MATAWRLTDLLLRGYDYFLSNDSFLVLVVLYFLSSFPHHSKTYLSSSAGLAHFLRFSFLCYLGRVACKQLDGSLAVRHTQAEPPH